MASSLPAGAELVKQSVLTTRASPPRGSATSGTASSTRHARSVRSAGGPRPRSRTASPDPGSGRRARKGSERGARARLREGGKPTPSAGRNHSGCLQPSQLAQDLSSRVSSWAEARCLKGVTRPTDTSSVAQADLRRVERAAANAAKSREQLRVAITLARAAGETLVDIGAAAGLSRQRIAQILRRSR